MFVFDFDGTVCLGDAPALAYARAVDDVCGTRSVQAALEAFIADPRADERFATCDDPYDVVNIAASAHGITEEQRSAAYMSSRAIAGSLPVHAPDGLHEFLASLRSTLVLVTNAPEAGLDGLLAALGLSGTFAQVVTSAGKPHGMRAFIEPHRTAGRPVMSIGDKWHNDLAPVAELGGSTALIDTYDLSLGHPADLTANALPELYPALREWEARYLGTPATANA